MAKPTKEDAALIIQIFNTATNDEKYVKAQYWFNFNFAMNEITYDEFKKKYPIGSEGYRNFNVLMSYAELVGTLVCTDVLSEDLVFEMWGNMFWDKSKPIVYGLREELKMPRFMENYEACVKRYPEWIKNHPIKI